MAKRKLGRGTGPGSSPKNVSKSARKFVIPLLLKTEQIEVDIKPDISDMPCADSKSSITSNSILFNCSSCGKSGNHYFGSEYRLVKTDTLVEVGAQTGDGCSEIPVEVANTRSLDDRNNLFSFPNSSTASPTQVHGSHPMSELHSDL